MRKLLTLGLGCAGNTGLGGGVKSRAMTGGFTFSDMDFFRRLKKDDGFFASVGGRGKGASPRDEDAVWGAFGKDFCWLGIWLSVFGVVRGRVWE